MPGHALQLIEIAPGSRSLRQILVSMASDISRLVCLDDSRLPVVRGFFEEDCAIDFRSLGEMVHQVSLVLKDPSIRLASTSVSRAAVQLACHEFDESSEFGRLRNSPGFHDAVLNAIRDLRHCGYEPTHLEACNDPKLSALSRLWTLVDNEFGELPVCFATDQMMKHLERDDVDLSPLAHVAVLQGSTRHPLLSNWLHWMARQGARVTVLVEGLGRESRLFAATRQIETDYGLSALDRVDKGNWVDLLFTKQELHVPAPKVEIHSACDRLTETEWVVRQCLQEVTAGTSHSKIVIICRSLEDYGIPLQFAAKRHGLSLHSTVSQPIGRNAFVDMILRLMRTLASNDVRAMREVLRSTFFGFSTSTLTALMEALIASYRLRAEQWQDLEERASAIEGAQPLLEILSWRELCLSHPVGLGEWLQRFRILIATEPFPDRFSGEQNPTRERDLRAFRALEREMAASASLRQAKNERSLNLLEFVEWCDVIAKNSETIITTGDKHGVRVVGSPELARDSEVAFVLGVLEGKWPRRRTDDAVLFDADRALLHHIFPEMPRISDSHDEARAERDHFVKLCAVASRKLVLSYPLTDGDRDGKPAFYLNELRRLFGTQIEQPPKLRRHIIPPEEECVSLADVTVRRGLNADRTSVGPIQLTTEKARTLIRPDWDRGVRLRHLATAAECPFHAAFRYQLKVNTPEDVTRPTILLSIPARASLSTQPTEEMARAAMMHELGEILSEQFSRREYWAWKLLEAAGKRLIDGWIEREFEMRERMPMNLDLTVTNVDLGEEGTKDFARLGGKRIRLRDGVDAISTLGNMSVVTSYRNSSLKTKDQAFASNRDKIYVGLLALACRRERTSMGYLVDSISGDRTLYLCNGSIDDLRQLDDQGVDYKRVDEGFEFLRLACDEAAVAVDAMERSLIRPKSGEHCDFCSYGELCRRSKDFGEQTVDIFAGDDE